jgi:hypothetical protein
VSRVTRRVGTKRSAKVNYDRPAGKNEKKTLFGSWFGRPYGRSLKRQ